MPVPRFSRDGVGCNIRELGQCPRPNCYPVVPVRVATLSHGPVNRTRGGQSVDPYASAAPETRREAAGATLDETRERAAPPLGSIQVVARDLLDKLDDASPQPWVLYPHERLGEREPVGRGEEVGNVGGRWRLPNSLGLPR